MSINTAAPENSLQIKEATSDEEIMACYPVMAELRTHLQAQDFLAQIRHMQSEGYHLAYLEAESAIVAVAGYRIYSNLFMGKHLYVDDLVTSGTKRSKGYGEVLLQHLRQIAVEAGCAVFHLDSGTQRKQAHKFYFQQGLSIASFHFSERLVDG